MKKALLGLFIAMVALALLFVAMVSCDDKQITFAEVPVTNTSISVPNGVIYPNLLPFCDFRDAVLVTQAPTVADDVGVYYTVGTFTSNAVYPSVSNSVLDSSADSYIYFIFNTDSSASSFFWSCKRLSGSNYMNFSITDGVNTYTDNGSTLGTITTNLRIFKYTIPTTMRGNKVLITIGVTYESYFCNLKYGLAPGFIVPELPLSSDVGDFYNNGIVAPNLLTNSDLYAEPVYNGVDYPNDSDISSLQNVWISNIYTGNIIYDSQARRCGFGFYEDKNLFYHAGKNLGSGDYTFTFALKTSQALTLTIGEYGYWLVNETIPATGNEIKVYSFTFDPSDYDTTEFPDGYRVTIEFTGTASSSAWEYIYYTKLERGSSFSGYVYPDHDISMVVRDNMLTNYDFSNVPSVASPETSTNFWTIDNSHATLYKSPDNPLTIECSTDYNLTYIVTSDYTVGNPLTFSLRASVGISALLGLHTTSFVVTIGSYTNEVFTPSAHYFFSSAVNDDPINATFTFNAVADLFIQLRFVGGSVAHLYYAKLEQGENFTGFVPSFEYSFGGGYDAGYSQGYIDGANAYSAFTKRLEFNDVENPSRLDNQGWSVWGFDNGADFYECEFGLHSFFYDSLDVTSTVSGKMPIFNNNDPDDELIGVGVWISRDLSFDIEENDLTYFIIIMIFDDYCICDMRDPSYPANWNPIIYPLYRVFELRVERGIHSLLEDYGTQLRKSGYNEGYTAGMEQGFLNGKAEGLAEYQSIFKNVGTSGWLGFFYAFVDVPVMIITSLLDYNVFGFNLLSIFKTLILITLIFLTIRLLTKGKVAQ